MTALSSPDVLLLRLLLRDGRLDAETALALKGAPNLDAALVSRGLLAAAEVAAYRAALGKGAFPDLGRVGDYRLVERLGQGGMGAVYAGEHVATGVRRAIKMATALRGANRERFRREGVAQAQVDSHENVLSVHEAGVDDGRHYLVMDLATGGDLAVRLDAHGPFEPLEGAELVAQLADGLQHVHEQGILHRDLKPANVLFDAAGVPKLVDFGLARLLDAETLTQTRALLGTPAYMAPEQARGRNDQVDARTDVYGLGTVLYECLTGRYMFSSSSGFQVLAQVISRAPIPPRSARPEIPRWLEEVCLKALAKAPEDRFQSAAELAAALRAGERVAGPRGRAGRLVLLAAALLVALGLALYAVTSPGAGRGGEDPGGVLAAEVRAGWAARGALAKDGPRVAALRGRLDSLQRASGAADSEELLRIDYELSCWEGWVSLAKGEAQGARAHLRAAKSLEGRLRRKAPGFEPSPLAAALGRMLAVERDPEGALEALAGVSPDLDRPELAVWADHARVHRSLRALEANDFSLALQALEEVEDLSRIPPQLKARGAARCRGEVDVLLRLIPGLAANEKAGKSGQGAEVNPILRILHRLQPDALTDEEFEALLTFATEPMRRVFTLAPTLADLRPDDVRVQRQVANHWLVVDGLTGVDRRLLARLYRPALERAFALVPVDERGDLGTKLAELLRVLHERAASRALCARLLDEGGLTGLQRARLLSTRGEAWREEGRLVEALDDFDASLAAADLALVHHRKSLALWQTRNRASFRDALNESLTFLRRSAPRGTGTSREGAAAYRRSVLIVWRAVSELDAEHARGAQAVDGLLSHFTSPDHVGWVIRRAYLRLRAGDRPGALADLERAGKELPESRKVADLGSQVAGAARAVADGDRDARALLWGICEELGKRKGEGELLP